MLTIKLSAAILIGIVLSTLVGCGTPQKHPNQLNAFDGASYDSLTAAHAALQSLRGTVSSRYPQYTTTFNGAAASYAVAYNAYAAYRVAPAGTAATALAISNLTVSIVALEAAFQNDLHVKPQTVLHVRGRAMQMRAAAQPHITISDILTELEIAATIASSVPVTQPYAGIAAIVIKTTQDAVAALGATSGQAIDLSTIQPVPSL